VGSALARIRHATAFALIDLLAYAAACACVTVAFSTLVLSTSTCCSALASYAEHATVNVRHATFALYCHTSFSDFYFVPLALQAADTEQGSWMLLLRPVPVNSFALHHEASLQ